MTTPPPAPAPGPALAAAVARQLSKSDDDAAVLEKLAPTVAAVNAVVRRWLSPLPDGSWSPDHINGATMLAARLYRRRNSVEGVATFTADAPVYVQRNDPDIAMQLQLGTWAPPVVG